MRSMNLDPSIHTRSTTGVFKQILTIILDQKLDSDLCQSLSENYIHTLPDLMTMTETDISLLYYKNSELQKEVLHRSIQSLLRELRSFIRQNEEEGITDHTCVTNDDFNRFRIVSYDPSSTLTATTNQRNISKITNNPCQPAEDFRRTIKRDKSHYKPLKENKQWDSWRRSTMATARSHGCEEILDPLYTPSTLEERYLFEEKNSSTLFLKNVSKLTWVTLFSSSRKRLQCTIYI